MVIGNSSPEEQQYNDSAVPERWIGESAVEHGGPAFPGLCRLSQEALNIIVHQTATAFDFHDIHQNLVSIIDPHRGDRSMPLFAVAVAVGPFGDVFCSARAGSRESGNQEYYQGPLRLDTRADTHTPTSRFNPVCSLDALLHCT